MQTEYKKKDLNNVEVENKEVVKRSVEHEYFFPGHGEFEAMTVIAENQEKATEKWLTLRKILTK